MLDAKTKPGPEQLRGKVSVDRGVQLVLEFMAKNIPDTDLVATAKAVATVAPALWANAGPQRDIGDPLTLFWYSEAALDQS